jgi:2-phosphosulfolactate phosphatase
MSSARVITSDLPPPPPDAQAGARPTHCALSPVHVDARALAGACVVIIDALRASVTVSRALAAGAQRVEPVLTVEQALARAAALRAQGQRVVVGGERGGVRPEGFDLGNSPSDYTPARVGGVVVVFSSTNGTGTLLHARGAARVLVGSMRCADRCAQLLAHDERPVWVLCAGTREEASMEDALVAGAIVEGLLARGRTLASDDTGRLCARLWRGARGYGWDQPGGVLEVFTQSRGGRNLTRLGAPISHDVAFCAQVDVPGEPVGEFDDAAGCIRPV